MIVCPKCEAKSSSDVPIECDWDHDAIMMIRINPECEKCKGTGSVTERFEDGGVRISSCKKCLHVD